MTTLKSTNSSQTKTIFLVLLGAIVFFISLTLLPKSPKIDKENVSVKIAKQKINDGEVMAGVKMLKDVLEINENNLDAIWELGKLSLESNQLEKAKGRFLKFISLTKSDEKASGLISLADCYYLQGNIKDAEKLLLEAKIITKDNNILIEIDDRLGLINKN